MKEFNLVDFTDSSFPFVILEGTHKGSFIPHMHDFIELEIIIGGKANHIVEGHAFPLLRGDVIVMLPSYSHELQDVFELEHYNIKFDLEKLLLFDTDIKKLWGFQALFILQPFSNINNEYTSHMRLGEDQLFYVKNLCDLIYDEWSNKKDGYRWVIRSYFLSLITYISRNYSPNVLSDTKKDHNLAKSVAYIHENLTRKITVSMLAKMTYLSERQYTRIFKEAYGITPMEYVIRCRLSLSCRMMKDTEKTLSEIGLACGFGDKVQFNRLFKKKYSIAPSEYRKKQN